MRRSTVLLGSTIGFAVLYLAGTGSLGTLPKSTDSGVAVVSWFHDNASHVHFALLFTTFALVFFAVYAAIIRGALPSPYGDVFLVGAIVLAVETAVQGWFLAGLSLHPTQLQPATARTVLDIAIYWGPLLTGATITMMLPIALLSFQRRAGLAPWLGVITGIAIVEQVIETVTIFGHHGFIAPGGPMNLYLGAGLVTVVFICTGIAISRSLTD
jgi:hypothetical protein